VVEPSVFRRVIVVGLDGFEPTLVDALVREGRLPNIGRMAAVSGVRRVATTFPAQTPVAWSTFATGVNPGGHGIFDFIHRDPSTYTPIVALNRYEQKSAFLPPRAVNLRRGAAVWRRLSDAGVPSAVLRCPCTYPADAIRGRMLSGMGVPDVLGGFGTGAFYTTRADVASQESETVVTLRRDGGRVQTVLLGPRVPRKSERAAAPIALVVAQDGQSVAVESAGEPRVLEVPLGRWSDWLKVKFPLGMLQSVRGMVRFRLISTSPDLELYASPVNFDPAHPLFPIGTPDVYSAELERRIGTYYTTGMVEDHAALNNGRIDEAAFFEQCRLVLDERERMLTLEADRTPEGFVFCLFDTPDRLQHMTWRFLDRRHPRWNEEESRRFENVVADHYRDCDAIVGRLLDQVDERTLLLVLSDHGFGSFRRGLNINRWLQAHGLLTLRSDAADEDSLQAVDWGRTKAYALGLGSVYLNLRGREAAGVVEPSEAGDILRGIVEGLSGLVDPATGARSVTRVVRRDEVYFGPYAHESPDLVVCFAEGYRASWATALGGVGEEVFEDNCKKWSGDHIVDPSLVPGFLVANRPLSPEPIRMTDLCPTILAALGASAPRDLEGRSLLEKP
jgi:predicted AlkP superfamily phosphohydrolase/phosphomutase